MDFQRETREGYDAIAAEYTKQYEESLSSRPIDRALLSAFSELVQEAGGGSVLEVGSGPGTVTAYLDGLGVAVYGVDLSGRMVEIASQTYPDLHFEVGSMLDLDVHDGALTGIVAYYSIIHVPLDHLPAVFAEFHRVLIPGGCVFVAFQVGDEPRRHTEAWGKKTSLTFYRRRPDRIAEMLAEAGLPVIARMQREPMGDEPTPQGYLFAHKPA